MENDFEGNKKMFWKEEKRVRKDKQANDKMVKDVTGQILRDGVKVRRIWEEYFEQVVNVADVREANINAVGNWRMPVLGDLNERAISLKYLGYRNGWISGGMFKVRWYGSDGMAI